MNESGATAFEVRAIISNLSGAENRMVFPVHYYRAILVEALTLLAEKKEGERFKVRLSVEERVDGEAAR